MGCEFGQSGEWNANSQLDWKLLQAGPYHRGLQRFVEDLGKLYLAEPALWKGDYDTDGFRWIDNSDHLNSVISFLRQDAEHFHELVVIMNLTPVPRLKYRIGLPRPGFWRELINSDATVYGGSNMGNSGGVTAADKPCHGLPCSAEFILPPLSILVFRPERAADKEVAVAAEAAPEKAPETSQVAKEVAAAGGAAVAPSKPALEPGRDAFHRIPDSALKALDKVERISTESKGARGAEVAGNSLPHGSSKAVLGGAADNDPAPKPDSGSLPPGT
jgi:1,4-alpha-glucan branching enzyme